MDIPTYTTVARRKEVEAMHEQDLEAELDKLSEDDAALFELVQHRRRDIGALADEINQLALVLDEVIRPTQGGWPVREMREKLLKIRERVSELILDNAEQVDEEPLMDFTVTHHVRAKGIFEVNELFERTSPHAVDLASNVEIVSRRVGTGVPKHAGGEA